MSALLSSFEPTWHQGEASELDAVLCSIQRKKPQLSALADFILPRVPRSLLCSNNLKTSQASSRRLRLSKAIRRQWVGWQAPENSHINLLVLDFDTEGWRDRLTTLVARGMPAPAYIAASPAGHVYDKHGQFTRTRPHETGQVAWVLAVPVKKASAKAYDLYQRVRAALIRELEADPAAAGHIGKNPFHPAYTAEVGPLKAVTLEELYKPMMEWCEAGTYFLPPSNLSAQFKGYSPNIAAVPKNLRQATGAKGDRLFNAARLAVYPTASRDFATILSITEDMAIALASPATPKQQRQVARSIHAFMSTRFKGSRKRSGIDHGVMTREAKARGQLQEWIRTPKAVKLPLAAERTNAIRGEKTERKILEALQTLAARGKPITQARIAAEAKVSERTIRKLWSENSRFSAKAELRSYPFLMLSEAAAPASSFSLGKAVYRLNETLRVVQEYLSLAVQMKKRGASLKFIPELPADYSPEMVEARKQAVKARRDCQRRAEKRKARDEGRTKRQNKLRLFRELAERQDSQGFEDFLRVENQRWDTLESHVARSFGDAKSSCPEDRAGRDKMRMRRFVAFKTHSRDWREAKRAAVARGIFRTNLDRTDRELMDAMCRNQNVIAPERRREVELCE